MWEVLGCLGASVDNLGPLSRPMLAVLGCSWGLCWRSWAALGAYVGGLGLLLGLCGPSGSLLGPILGILGRSWDLLGAYVGGPGPLLGPLLAVLSRLGPKNVEEHGKLENVLISRTGARSAASGGRLEPLLGPILAVLGRSWSLCWRSWAALGAYVGDPGPLLEPMLAVLEHLGAEVVGLGAKSDPGPSGKAIWQGDQAGKWPKPKREGRSGEAMELECFPGPGPPCRFFSVDTS